MYFSCFLSGSLSDSLFDQMSILLPVVQLLVHVIAIFHLLELRIRLHVSYNVAVILSMSNVSNLSSKFSFKLFSDGAIDG